MRRNRRMDFPLLHDLTQVHGRSHIPPRRAGDSRPAPAVFGIGGAVAQLGERYVRNVEVRGSIPLGSTIFINVSNELDEIRRNPRSSGGFGASDLECLGRFRDILPDMVLRLWRPNSQPILLGKSGGNRTNAVGQIRELARDRPNFLRERASPTELLVKANARNL